jgi:hypothetical protein
LRAAAAARRCARAPPAHSFAAVVGPAPEAEQPADQADDQADEADVYEPTLEVSRDGQVDPLELAWFDKAADIKDEPLTLSKIVAAVGEARLSSAEGQLVQWMTENREPLCMLRLRPLGAPEDTVEAMAWVPASWGQAGIVGEGLRGHGAPQLLTGQLGSARFAPAS